MRIVLGAMGGSRSGVPSDGGAGAEYGGAPLLGVNGIVVIGHGGSSVKAFRNAIDVVRTTAARKLNRHIEEAVSEFVASTATDDKLKEGA